MHWTARHYQGVEDAAILRSFLVSMQAGAGHACWHRGDLVWRFFLHSLGHELAETVRLWFDGQGRLQAFAIVTPRSRAGNLLFDVQVRPRARSQALYEQVLSWVKAQAEAAAPAPRLLRTDTGVYDTDVEQVVALQGRGFRLVDDEALLLVRSLQEPIPIPALPAGFRLRPVAGPQEAGPRAQAHRDAFDSTRVTGDAYLRLMGTAGYAAEWDLAAEAPDGSLAAFCLVWPDAASRSGEFEPVGTCPAFRRLGLARALLLEGLRRLAEAGAASAVVGPIDAGEEAALALYRSAGFRPAHRLSTYAREWAGRTGSLPETPAPPGRMPPGGPQSRP
jgi:ribosomal protein S18 acetylase RimI-like enzyme